MNNVHNAVSTALHAQIEEMLAGLDMPTLYDSEVLFRGHFAAVRGTIYRGDIAHELRVSAHLHVVKHESDYRHLESSHMTVTLAAEVSGPIAADEKHEASYLFTDPPVAANAAVDSVRAFLGTWA